MLRTVYITIMWIPGRVPFLNKKKKIFDTSEKTLERLVEELIEETATTLKRKTMSESSVQSISKDFYYMVYETENSTIPFLKSQNAPYS